MVYEEIFFLNVFCTFETRHITILGQGEGAHIVLVNNIGLNFVTLGLEELLCVQIMSLDLSYSPIISLLVELLNGICFVLLTNL